MMRTGWWMLGLSLAAGGVSTLLAAGWLGSHRGAPTTSISVAARDVEAGQVLDAAAIKVVDWPSTALPTGAQTDPNSLVGRAVRTALIRGEPILVGKLAADGVKGGLAAVITPGRRAITVRVNEVVGVAGFALPGNHVDVLVNAPVAASGGQSLSRIVLERILVLAVAQESGRDETRPRVVSAVTLEVTPQQAETLDLARAIGQLSLVLRHQTDQERGVGRGITTNDLLAMADRRAPATPEPVVAASPPSRVRTTPPAAQPVAPPAVVQIEVIRGVLKSSSVWSAIEVSDAR